MVEFDGPRPVDYQLVEELRAVVAEQLSDRTEAREDEGRPLTEEDKRQLTRALIGEQITQLATDAYRSGEQPLDGEAEDALAGAVFDHIHGLGRIQPLIDDPEVTDIEINGCDQVFVQRVGEDKRVRGPAVAESDEQLLELIQQTAKDRGRSERQFDETNWRLNMQLPSGARLEATQLVSRRPSVTIRCHNFKINRLEHLVELGTIDRRLYEFLRAVVLAGKNVLVAGETGTGKTTMLRCLLNEAPPEERLITVEDQPELAMHKFLDRHPNQVSLVAEEANSEGRGRVGLGELVRQTLRKNPDRVVLGEVMGAEALWMLKVMSQGNDGSMSTMHADDAQDALVRLDGYVTEADNRPSYRGVAKLIAAALDVVLFLDWVDGKRQLTEVLETGDAGGPDGLQVEADLLWHPGDDGRAVPTGNRMRELADDLAKVGFSGPIDTRATVQAAHEAGGL